MSDHTTTAMPGYHGRYLRIDLSTGQTRFVPLPDSVLRRFIGGSGLGTYLLLREGAAAVDPLSPEAPLGFVFSPLVSSPVTTTAKFAVVSKGALSGRINDSLASGGFAIAGKQCGCDALVLVGRVVGPSILVVDDGNVEIVPAGDLCGLSSGETQQRLAGRLAGNFQIAAIGPAGERLVRYATISHGSRHAGRGGSGAVMGAKNLKAVAVRGTRQCEWARPDGLAAAAEALSARSFGPATAKYRELGTAANLLLFNRLGALPVRNFQAATFAAAEELSPERLAATRRKTRSGCAACTIGCQHIYSTSGSGDGAGAGVRVEYENLFALGPLCGVSDPDTVLAASGRCDELGLDTISTGGTIAFAAECAERGLLDAAWLRFGDGDAVLRAIDLIGSGEGLGRLLGQGSRRMARRIGRGAIDFAPQVKGLEIPGYEPRVLTAMALGFAVGTRGADHNRSGAYQVDFSADIDRGDVDAIAAAAVETEDRAAVFDSLILCKFLRGVFDDFFSEAAELLNLATGWETTAAELRTAARRIIAAKKLLNIRAGWHPDEDTLPARFFDQPLPDSGTVLSRNNMARLVAAYNRRRGWTPEGRIEPEKLGELGLADL